MSFWPVRDTLDVLAVGKRLAASLVVLAVYYLAAGFVVQTFDLSLSFRGDFGSLINTLMLGLLMSFRNQAAYQRWWDARGLWGQLTNDSRNLAAKCAEFLPAEALVRSRIAEILVNYPEALRCHLQSESLQLRNLPGFEQETVDPPHVPLYLAQRVFAVIAEWESNGDINQGVLWILDIHARGLLEVCGGCEKIRNTPLSPSYKSLLRTGLVLNILVAPWMIVPEDGLWSLAIVLPACFFLLGVELIDSIVEEPFGRDRDDLDLDRYCQTIREGVEASLPLGVKG